MAGHAWPREVESAASMTADDHTKPQRRGALAVAGLLANDHTTSNANNKNSHCCFRNASNEGARWRSNIGTESIRVLTDGDAGIGSESSEIQDAQTHSNSQRCSEAKAISLCISALKRLLISLSRHRN